LPELTREALTELFKKHHPSDLASLKKLLSAEDFPTNERELLTLVDQLISDGTIEASPKTTSSFREYLLDIWTTWWFYASIVIALFEVFLVVLNAQAGIALFIRIVFGLGIFGIIPGLLTTLVLFPRGQLVTLERIALSIFLSVLIAIAVGVLLGLGPYFEPSNNIIVLAAYVVLMDIAASYRSYQFSRRFQ
jgi:uncharacterized membrane protein